MVTNGEQVVTRPEAEAGGDGGLQTPEASAFITMSVRMSAEDHARLQKLALIAYRWGLIKRDSLSEIIRFGLALAAEHVRAVYLKKKGG